jgi:hypothetical protein
MSKRQGVERRRKKQQKKQRLENEMHTKYLEKV